MLASHGAQEIHRSTDLLTSTGFDSMAAMTDSFFFFFFMDFRV